MTEDIKWKKIQQEIPAIDGGKKATNDPVERPAHYNHSGIECITYLEDNLGAGFSYYLEGNVKKYLHRWRFKGGSAEKKVEDLRKAAWYLDRLISSEKTD
jgi:hypothetical protein